MHDLRRSRTRRLALESNHMPMKKLLIALATTVALVGPAAAGTSTYMCRVADKLYPVTVTTPNEGDSSSLDEKETRHLGWGHYHVAW